MLLRELKKATRKFVKMRPTTVYKRAGDGCSYTQGECSDGTFGCLFGQLNAELELDLCLDDDEARINEVLAAYYNRSSADLPLRWFSMVQKMQDLGFPWAECVEEADKFIKWMRK